MLDEVLIGGFGFDDMWTPLKSLIKSLVSREGGDPPLDVEVLLEDSRCRRWLTTPKEGGAFMVGGGGGGSKHSTGLVVMFFDGFSMPFSCLGPFVSWTTGFDVSLGMAMILGPELDLCKGHEVALELAADATTEEPPPAEAFPLPPLLSPVSSRLKMASKSESVAEAIESGLHVIRGGNALPKGSM